MFLWFGFPCQFKQWKGSESAGNSISSFDLRPTTISLWGSHCGNNGYKESMALLTQWALVVSPHHLWWQQVIARLWLLTNKNESSALAHPPSILYFSYHTFSRDYLNFFRFRAIKGMSRLYDDWFGQVGMSIFHLDAIAQGYDIRTPPITLPLSAHYRFPWVYHMYSSPLSLARVWIRSKMSECNIDVEHQIHGVQSLYIMKEKEGWKSHRKEGVQWNS